MSAYLKIHERQQLESAYQSVRDKRTASKINLILLLDDGYSFEEVAAILRLDKSTVRRHEKAYQVSGLKQYLKNPFSGGTCKLEFEQIALLERYLDDQLCQSTDEVIDYVESQWSISYTRAGMSALLRRLGFVYKKPRIIPGKVDPALQQAFIEYYFQIKKSMGCNDRIYFLDGVHPHFNTEAGFGWIRKGGDKDLKSNTGRQRVNINGAMDPDSLEVIARADDSLNAESTIELFKMIEEHNPDCDKIVLFVDNALYYYNGDVVEYANNSRQLELVYLPPYSPNLNLIERLWLFMKKKVIYNKHHETFQDFKVTLGNFFQNIPKYYDELSQIMNEDFQVYNNLV